MFNAHLFQHDNTPIIEEVIELDAQTNLPGLTLDEAKHLIKTKNILWKEWLTITKIRAISIDGKKIHDPPATTTTPSTNTSKQRRQAKRHNTSKNSVLMNDIHNTQGDCRLNVHIHNHKIQPEMNIG
jgi:hypothetical protein